MAHLTLTAKPDSKALDKHTYPQAVVAAFQRWEDMTGTNTGFASISVMKKVSHRLTCSQSNIAASFVFTSCNEQSKDAGMKLLAKKDRCKLSFQQELQTIGKNLSQVRFSSMFGMLTKCDL